MPRATSGGCRPGLAGAVCCRWLALALALLVAPLAPAQEALRSSLAGQAAAEARRVRPESQNYTLKSGDFRLLIVPSLGIEWNDNINVSKADATEDFILKPFVQLNASYPLTTHNLLTLSVGVGYDQYLKHDEYSAWRLQSGSELSFDTYVKDFWINFHDRMRYVQDSAQEAAVSGTAEYATFDNTAGLLVTWDLQDVTLSLGYDHENVVSGTEEFESQDRATEMLVGRAGFQVHPRLVAGVEATGSFTAYDQMVLNDNTGYSAGVYADWQPGSYFRLQPRAGYAAYQFKNTSAFMQTSDINSWYVSVIATHDITESVSYSIDAGHELRLGIESDVINAWYVRPSLNWHVVKNLSLRTFFSYEHGKQGEGNVAGNLTETYDWFGGGVGLSYPLMKRLTLALNYRLTLRSSSSPDREYTQNLVGLQLTYRPL